MSKTRTIQVEGSEIAITIVNDEDYISLTDMSKKFGDDSLIYSWMRNRNSVEFLGVWEQLHNPDFKGGEFETFKKEAGLNSFHLTPKKWIEATNAIGIKSRAGRYNGGTYAHKDIAFEFGSWLSPTFKLYLIKEFQRLKEIESNQYNLEWNVKRVLSKVNYQLHTDSIKDNIIPKLNIDKEKEWLIYAEEADILNVALFGCTAKQWREANPSLAISNQNIRDFASINELAVLSNLESLNALLIEQDEDKAVRFNLLRKQAQSQLASLNGINFVKSLKHTSDTIYSIKEKPIN